MSLLMFYHLQPTKQVLEVHPFNEANITAQLDGGDDHLYLFTCLYYPSSPSTPWLEKEEDDKDEEVTYRRVLS